MHKPNSSFRAFSTREALTLSGGSVADLSHWKGERGLSNEGSLGLPDIHQFMEDAGLLPSRPVGARAARLGVFSANDDALASMTTNNLATYYAMKGWRVAAIDATPRAHLCRLLRIERDPFHTSSKGVLAEVAKGAGLQSPQSTAIHGLDAIPASVHTSAIDCLTALGAAGPRLDCVQHQVSDQIAAIEQAYDIVFYVGTSAFTASTVAAMCSMDGFVMASYGDDASGALAEPFCELAADTLANFRKDSDGANRTWAPFEFISHGGPLGYRPIAAVRRLVDGPVDNCVSINQIPVNPAFAAARASNLSIWSLGENAVTPKNVRAARHSVQTIAGALMERLQWTWHEGHLAPAWLLARAAEGYVS